MGPPGSDIHPCATIQHLTVEVFPHGNPHTARAGVCEKVRCLNACFLMLFSQVCWSLKRFFLRLIYMSRPLSDLCSPTPTGTGLLEGSISRSSPLPSLACQEAFLLACQSVVIDILHSHTYRMSAHSAYSP